jgi:hypothetical protein
MEGIALRVKSGCFCSLFIFPCHQGGCPISPDFLWGLMGTSELHAAFLTESRTRGTGWGSVQEIRVSPRFLWGDVGNFTALCRQLLEFRSISEVSRSSSANFPHLPTKSVVRYGAPALVAGKMKRLQKQLDFTQRGSPPENQNVSRPSRRSIR